MDDHVARLQRREDGHPHSELVPAGCDRAVLLQQAVAGCHRQPDSGRCMPIELIE
ncbi:hypothetical protein [Synechococcus sp. MIT S1220]|uniref:hypothetical protein n=1 Tax=Synechococcus sp. MIT S1220 TaxID=3082549 RepID=UPI0039AEA978